MRKVIATMNMTLDGFCDHTSMNADDEIHQHYTDLLNSAGTLLYGRITYQLMESYWPTVVKNPTGERSTDEFAIAIENIPKVVFSRTLKNVDWKNVRLATRDLKDEVEALKQEVGKDIFVGSPSLIVGLTNLNLIDEYQLCVQPTIVGKGLRLLENINERVDLRLVDTKMLPASGSIILCHQPNVWSSNNKIRSSRPNDRARHSPR
jgi:dihydrofolate reductase